MGLDAIRQDLLFSLCLSKRVALLEVKLQMSHVKVLCFNCECVWSFNFVSNDNVHEVHWNFMADFVGFLVVKMSQIFLVLVSGCPRPDLKHMFLFLCIFSAACDVHIIPHVAHLCSLCVSWICLVSANLVSNGLLHLSHGNLLGISLTVARCSILLAVWLQTRSMISAAKSSASSLTFTIGNLLSLFISSCNL